MYRFMEFERVLRVFVEVRDLVVRFEVIFERLGSCRNSEDSIALVAGTTHL